VETQQALLDAVRRQRCEVSLSKEEGLSRDENERYANRETALN
jgi:hypothetical protein